MSSNVSRNTVSKIINDKESVEDEEPKKKSREDWRKAKELEEARKAGTAPAAQDEEGKDINPHIPQYISTVPWYYGNSGPTLKHQRPQHDSEKERGELHLSHLSKGIDTTKVFTKFRKGACENCGAMTHKRKDCLERPRKVMAKFQEHIVAHDEHIRNLPGQNGYDEKRDRWSLYDPANHKEIVEEFEQIEEAKRQLKADKLQDNPNAEISEEEEEADEDRYVDNVDMPGTKVDSKQRITVRNLRIREDTAKYLRNLDPNSAYYDPKTRSMRDNPNPLTKPDEVEFAGENFVRFTGDTQKHTTAQLFAWEAHGKGVDVHLLAEPTKLELLQKEYEKKKEEFKSETKDTILDKYGGEEHLKAPPKALLLAQTEEYVEYSRSGKVIKGLEKQKVKSRYEEDVYINNHSQVWGSYWNAGRWGYKCCLSFIRNSYCVGSKQPQENVTSPDNSDPFVSSLPSSSRPAQPAKPKKTRRESSSSSSSSSSDSDSSDSSSSDSSSSDASSKKSSKPKKLSDKERELRSKRAMEEDMKSKKEEDSENLEIDDRKRKYNSKYETQEPTEEELEDFMKKRIRPDDPMANFMK